MAAAAGSITPDMADFIKQDPAGAQYRQLSSVLPALGGKEKFFFSSLFRSVVARDFPQEQFKSFLANRQAQAIGTPAPVQTAATPPPPATAQTGSSAAGHGTSAGYTPKKKKKVASTRGTANLRSALLSTSGGSAELG